MRPLSYEDLRAVESTLDEMYDTVTFWDSASWLQAPDNMKMHETVSACAAKLYELTQKMRLYIAPDSRGESFTDGVADVLDCDWCGAPTKYPTDRDGRQVCIACSIVAK